MSMAYPTMNSSRPAEAEGRTSCARMTAKTASAGFILLVLDAILLASLFVLRPLGLRIVFLLPLMALPVIRALLCGAVPTRLEKQAVRVY